MSILERINSSYDIKSLSEAEIELLCSEIRDFLVESVSKTGGHLASNLGAVELTVAIHRVYDTSKDRLVFDVGHQSYVHKIITGRRDKFAALRQLGGLSGFPKPYEADDDAFIAGHASNSVSVALGMARARTALGESYDVVSVIGDGALTGGLAYEGLANAASSGEPMVIILNDNNMSISRNVGGTSRLLQEMRVRPAYIRFKRWYRAIFKKLPILYNFNHKLKERIKSRLIPENMFDEMGIYYIGPVDGHDVKKLENILRWARDLRQPVLVHVLTKKGKGYKYAELSPDVFHGVGKFDPKTGKTIPAGITFSDIFGSELCTIAEENPRIVAVTAAMSSGTGLSGFEKEYPKRFFDVGIAEGHGVSMCAGMAKQGLIPVFAVYSSFLQRGFDMLIHDVSLQKLHTVFAIDRAGIVGNDGETHHGVFDVGYMGLVPGMTILAPASFQELREMLRYGITQVTGPVAIRYPRGGEGLYRESHLEEETVLREGKDVTIVSYGSLINEALKASDMLSARGITCDVLKLGMLAPTSFEKSLASIKKTGKIVVAEEVCNQGCVGDRILSCAAVSGISGYSAKLLNLGDGIVVHGDTGSLLRQYGIDSEAICSSVLSMIEVEINT